MPWVQPLKAKKKKKNLIDLPSIAALQCVSFRCGLDPELLWLWCRPAATALIRPLAWELPYAMGAALEKTERQKNKKNRVAI